MFSNLALRLPKASSLASVLLAALAGCAHAAAPVPLAAIPTLASLDDVMEEQEHTAAPAFARLGQSALTEADFALFGDAARRLQATALRTKDFAPGFNRPDAFAALATTLQTQARALEEASATKDADAARRALASLQGTCKTCHSQFD